MSKRPDENEAPDMEAGMTTAERRRRRRRGGGLRVPSDNVPRRSPTTPPVVPPVPEDPNLAVSIAYSFASDGSGPMPRSDTAELPVAEMRPDTLTGDGPDVGDVIMAPDAQSTAVDVDDLDDGDGQFEAKTREMDAVDLEALGLTDPSEEAKQPKQRAPSVPGPSTSIIIDDDQMTAIAPPPRLQASSQPPPVRPHPTSQPPPLKAQAQARPAPVTAPVLSRAPPGTEFPPPDAFDEDEKSIEIDVDYVGRGEDGPTLQTPIAPVTERRPEAGMRLAGRASTVALSDDDLEELRDGGSGRVKVGSRSGETVQLSDTDLEDDDVSERAETPSLDKLARAGKDESGEIVVDVIEEVDSGDMAAPVAPLATSTAPGVGATRPSGSMPQLNGSAQVQRPPPTPPGAHATPTHTGTTVPPPNAGPPAVAKAPVEHTPPPPPAATKTPPPAPGKKPGVATTAAAVAAAGAAAKAPDGKRAKRGKPWFEEIFDEDYLRTLPFLTPQATQSEAQFVVDALGVQAGAQLLDLGCGYGRHAMELAARGFHLVGLDLSLPLLLRGADEAQRRGLSINFVHADMRELDFDAQFDGVYCLFSTFGFFDDETNKKTATAVARALKPGGRCVIEVLNRDYVIGELPTRVWWEGDGCVVLEEVEFNYFSSRIHSNRSVVFDDGRQIEQEISVRAYSLHELGKLLHAAGFRVVEVSGSVHTRGRYFGNHSRHIIVVAEKKPKDGHDNGK